MVRSLSSEIPHVRTLWERALSTRSGNPPSDPAQWSADNLVINELGLGLHDTLRFLYERAPDLPAFEAWILERNSGGIEPERIVRLNGSIDRVLGKDFVTPVRSEFAEDALAPDDIAFWEEHGYVVVPKAVSAEAAHAAELAIWEFAGMSPDDPESWYGGEFEQGIMVPLLHHPALAANRNSPRIRRAFEQLWGTNDLVITVDRCGFNPPERVGWQFHATGLHWDTSLVAPVPFGTQGILYLTDTPVHQGAFRCVAGFHKKLESWLASLPKAADPRREDLDALGPVCVAGNTGDLIIWRNALPHGASPNRGTRPRIAQYINMYPPDNVDTRPWL